MSKVTFQEHTAQRTQDEEAVERRKQSAMASAEQYVRIQEEGKAFWERAIAARNKPKGDIPIRPKPNVPDIATGFEYLDLDFEPKAVKDAEAELVDLEEQLSVVLAKVTALPQQIEEATVSLANSGDTGVAGELVFMKEDLEALQTHRLPKLQKQIAEARDVLEVARHSAEIDVFVLMAQEVDRLDLQRLGRLREFLVLSLRSKVLRDAANGIRSHSSSSLYDWVYLISGFAADIGKNIEIGDIESFEQRVIERCPEKFWRV